MTTDIHSDLSRAAFTIVSNNYLAHARALAYSFSKFHAEIPFFVILVDSYQKKFSLSNDPFSIIRIDELPIPVRGYFEYQYDVMELNTAVKPFAMKHLFAHGFDQVVYFDPDIYIFSTLDEIFSKGHDSDALLIPHVQTAFYDQAHPNDINILQSGTYNLGFISLFQTDLARNFLHWWSEKLFSDCVVDIPNGLFVDQKWVDFAPAMMDCKIIKHPGYNVAYWNLHEKTFEIKEDVHKVNGKDLAFFHFSGFNADNPQRLSKHESRFGDGSSAIVRDLCQFYSSELKRCRIDQVKAASYEFDRLPNGVKLSLPIRRVIRQCIKDGIEIPSPRNNPDAFCTFLTTPNPVMNGIDVAPLVTQLLEYRKDVNSAFPDACTSKSDPGFMSWFKNSFKQEYDQAILVEKFGTNLSSLNSAERITSLYENRPDLQKAYPDAFRSSSGYEEFVKWCRSFGLSETDITSEDVFEFERSKSGAFRILDIYFARPDLMSIFMDLHRMQVQEEFFSWLRSNLSTFDKLSYGELVFFNQVIRYNRAWFTCVNYPASITLSGRRQLKWPVGELGSGCSAFRF